MAEKNGREYSRDSYLRYCDDYDDDFDLQPSAPSSLTAQPDGFDDDFDDRIPARSDGFGEGFDDDLSDRRPVLREEREPVRQSSPPQKPAAAYGMADDRRSISRYISILCVAGLIVTAIAAVYIWFGVNRTVIGSLFAGQMCTVDSEELVLTKQGISDFSNLKKLRSLRRLDVSELPISPGQYEEICSLVPEDCSILWRVPFAGDYIASDTTELSIASYPAVSSGDLDNLGLLTGLRSLDANGFTDYEAIGSLADRLPDCDIQWSVQAAGNTIPSDTAELTIDSGWSAEDISSLRWLKDLKHIDATACTDYPSLLALSEKLPGCEILWRVNVAGVAIDSTAETASLGGASIASGDALVEALSYLPKLKKLDMCGCGLSDSQMGELQSRTPNTFLVWELSFGDANHHWTVRTDAECFSSLNGGMGTSLTVENYKPLLLYCTELRALDLGHSQITDLSLFANLTKMQALTLADNPVSDLSPLAAMKDLQYLDLWGTKVSDLTPLSGMKNLMFISLQNCYVNDVTPLYSVKSLRYLIINSIREGRNMVKEAEVRKLAAILPECNIDVVDLGFYYDSPSRKDVREKQLKQYKQKSDIYIANRLAWSNWSHVVKYYSYDNIVYSPGYLPTYVKL